MQQVMQEVVPVLQFGLYALIAFAMVYIARLIANARTTDIDDDKEIEENSNLAIALRKAGLYAGIIIGLHGALSYESKGFKEDLLGMAVFGALVVVMMFITRAINDSVLLGGINNDAEAKKGNAAVGVVEVGSYVATGLVMHGALTGESSGLWNGVLLALVYFIIGQVALFVMFKIYDAATPYKIQTEVGNGNVSAGIGTAGILIALGFILKASASNLDGGLADLHYFALRAVIGLVFLAVFHKLIDWFLLPNTNLNVEVERDKNSAALVLSSTTLAMIAMLVSAVI